MLSIPSLRSITFCNAQPLLLDKQRLMTYPSFLRIYRDAIDGAISFEIYFAIISQFETIMYSNCM